MEYNFKEIEAKWQKYWRGNKTYKVFNDTSKPAYYVLDMFPYPSGAGLHVGHPLGYIASDIYSRYKRLRGFNVLHPMGFDSFGLPAEQYAIQTGQHPAITTEQNIERYREQLDKMGFSFDWDREVRTSDPGFYKWTQWIFIKFFHSWYNNKTDKAERIETLIEAFDKNGNITVDAACSETKKFSADEWKNFSEKEKHDILMNYRLAYLSEAMVNWCPALGTVLANDEVKDGVSERGGYPVERKLMPQWSMRITAYSQRLLDGLDNIDWSESLKEAQRNWIGKSEGSTVRFRLTPAPSPEERGMLRNDERMAQHYQTADARSWKQLKGMSRDNRKKPAEAENILWQRLRNNQLGFKIRRQHAIETFIVDFVCIDRMLVIEVDGNIHDQQLEYDAERTRIIESFGFKVIRFSNERVFSEEDKVVDEIKHTLEARPENAEHYWKGNAGENATSGSQSNLSEAGSPLLGRGDRGEAIEIFTTRPDTIFGATYITLAPEHELIDQLTTAEYKNEVEEYISWAKNRSERDRQADVKKITGVFTGAYAEHPFTKKSLPIWVGDYVLAGYGTGAVMAVPAHDTRDYAFAKHFGLPVVEVIKPNVEWNFDNESYDEKEGTCINSDFLNGLEVKDAIKRVIEEIEKRGLGKGKINFRLRDAIFGRQRYWGEPIPVYYKDGIAHTLPENELPLILPEVDKYLPTESGEPPLARANNWKYKEQYDYEHTTMPGWAGSSWYYLRYMDANNDKEFASKAATDYWKNVDLYIGGTEHATGHLLYFRFWTMFLKDFGYIEIDEPAKKLINQGMIQGTSAIVYRIDKRHNVENEKCIEGSNLMSELPQVFVSKSFMNTIKKSDDRNLVWRNNDQVKKIEIKLNEIARSYDHEFSGSIELLPSETQLHVDVNFVDNSVLNIEKFKQWRKEFSDAEFILDDGKYITGHEIEKMSKRWYNVVNPDEICEKYGADCLRMYEMFLGPLEQSKPWNTNGITGVSGFLKKLWRLFENAKSKNFDAEVSRDELKVLHKTIKKITEDIERFSFNTSVSAFMICVNELTDLKTVSREILEPLVILISPFAPHVAEELWETLNNAPSVTQEKWIAYDEQYLAESSFEYPISINGKTKFKMQIALDIAEDEIKKQVLSNDKMKELMNGNEPKKIIIVPGKIVNVVL